MNYIKQRVPYMITNVRYPIIDSLSDYNDVQHNKRERRMELLFGCIAVIAVFTSLFCVWMVTP
mgnify:FL=1